MKILRVLFFAVFLPFNILAHPGIGLVYDGDQTIYYTDLVHIWKMNTLSGEASIFLENIHSHELWLDADGSLYGEHYWYDEGNKVFKHYIWKATSNGELTRISDITIGENEHFSFVRNSMTESYSTQSNDSLYRLIKTSGDSIITFPDFNLFHPGWMYLTNKSKLLILDRDILNDNVVLHQVDFETSSRITIAEELKKGRLPFSLLDDHSSVYGIWQDDQSNTYVALYGGREVVRIDEQLNQETVLKTSFFWSPVNGVFDSDNHLWLLEASVRGKFRLRKIEQAL